MNDESKEFLKKLINTPSPSGFEQKVQSLVKDYMKKYADEVRTDLTGNVIGVYNLGGKPKIMLTGHCDEIGLMVINISNEGYIYFSNIGGIDTTILPGLEVKIHSRKGEVKGVIGKKPIHLLDSEERKKEVKISDLWIDIGAKNKTDAQKYVSVGDCITFSKNFTELKNGIISANGFDDKIGVYVVSECLKKLHKSKICAEVYFVSTVQEELGLRGARTSAFSIEPQIGIAVDVDFATDFPTVDKKVVGEVKLGKGPTLHRGANINPIVGELLVKTAETKKIPYQFTGSPRSTGTDANAIQISKSGVATANIGIPNRYMHTPVECISLNDVENAVKLLVEFIKKVDSKINLYPV